MPKIQFTDLPRAIDEHLLARIDSRNISPSQLRQIAIWKASDPEAPEGDWYKDFGSFFLVGCGRYPKTLLSGDMKPYGTEIF